MVQRGHAVRTHRHALADRRTDQHQTGEPNPLRSVGDSSDIRDRLHLRVTGESSAHPLTCARCSSAEPSAVQAAEGASKQLHAVPSRGRRDFASSARATRSTRSPPRGRRVGRQTVPVLQRGRSPRVIAVERDPGRGNSSRVMQRWRRLARTRVPATRKNEPPPARHAGEVTHAARQKPRCVGSLRTASELERAPQQRGDRWSGMQVGGTCPRAPWMVRHVRELGARDSPATGERGPPPARKGRRGSRREGATKGRSRLDSGNQSASSGATLRSPDLGPDTSRAGDPRARRASMAALREEGGDRIARASASSSDDFARASEPVVRDVHRARRHGFGRVAPKGKARLGPRGRWSHSGCRGAFVVC